MDFKLSVGSVTNLQVVSNDRKKIEALLLGLRSSS